MMVPFVCMRNRFVQQPAMALARGLLLASLAWFGKAARADIGDYQKALQLRAMTQGKVRGMDVHAAWSPDETFLFFERIRPDGAEWERLDLTSGRIEPAFGHRRLAAFLTKAFHENVASDKLPITRIAVDEKRRLWLLCRHAGKVIVTRIDQDGAPREVPAEAAAPFQLGALPRTRLPSSRDLGGSTYVLFVNATPRKVELFWIDRQGKRKRYGEIPSGGMRVQQTYAGHVWLATVSTGKRAAAFVAEKEATVAVIGGPPKKRKRKSASAFPHGRPPASQEHPSALSPDGRRRVFTRDFNVFLHDVKTGKEFPLSTDGTKDNVYGSPFYWSPDGSHLVVKQTRPAQKHTVYLLECAPPDQLQPKLHEINYLKPGDRIAVSRPRLFDVAARRAIPMSDRLFPTPWALTRFHWSPNGRRFYFLYNQRGHQVMRLVAGDAQTGRTTTVIEERSRTFIDYSQKTFLHYLDATEQALWMSERSGWNHLYLVDLKTGAIRPVTQGRRVVRKVVAIDEKNRTLLLEAFGVYPNQDPYYTHFARVRFDGSGFTLLTKGDGDHRIDFSPSGRYYIDTYSRVDLPPVHELRRWKDGSLVAELSRADASALLRTGWKPPLHFVAKGRDGKTDIYGVLFRPTDFSPKRNYPVIESIYAGPQGFHTPKRFASFYGEQELAELGFIVVIIDGMGTNWRSKAFHDVCWKNLGDAGFPDRIAWLRAAAKRYPWMDVTRVGIYGVSAGGQNAMRALIDHGGFYTAAVADSGCHDNRMDKIWWNEAWMGWPVDKEAYDRSSNVVGAPRMKGHLMLMVGLLDHNVDPASTFQVVEALVKANKDYELLVFPEAGHGAGQSAYGKRRMYDFFLRHLYGCGLKVAEGK